MHTTTSFIEVFSRLGHFLRQFPDPSGPSSRKDMDGIRELNHRFYDEFAQTLEQEPLLNPWFIREFVLKALEGIASMLEEKVLQKWLRPYRIAPVSDEARRTVGLVLAGNIPLVGFHDLMSVLACGHRVLAKPSSRDDRLIRKVADLISFLDPELGSRIRFTDEKLTGIDAVIATGSDNSARYFEYYFRDLPHVIRKNRNGVAVLSGNESKDELSALGRDIFTYFGMGCRNVTKLYVPEDYDLKNLLQVLDRFQDYSQHHKYANNVEYYRTMFLMNQVSFLDNGVLLLKEDPAIASPVGVVFYERYSEIEQVQRKLVRHREEIQCIVSTIPDLHDSILPGYTQEPMPWEYADGVDTIRFLKELA